MHIIFYNHDTGKSIRNFSINYSPLLHPLPPSPINNISSTSYLLPQRNIRLFVIFKRKGFPVDHGEISIT